MLTNDDLEFLQSCIDKAPLEGVRAFSKAVEVFQKLNKMREAHEIANKEVVQE